MKKLTLALAMGAMAFAANAQELVKDLYAGDAVEVTWASTLAFDAADFADVNVGNFIEVDFSKTTNTIEFKSGGEILPGSLYTWLGNSEAHEPVKAYITAEMLVQLQKGGLELCGDSFTVTAVKVLNDGFAMPEGAIWGGYCWIDGWKTLELCKAAFNDYTNQRYLDIHFAADKGDFTNYVVNVMTAFDNDAAKWSNADNLSLDSHVATLDLENIDVKARLAAEGVNTLLIQVYQGDGNPAFNMIAVTLRGEKSGQTAVSAIATYPATVDVYNLQGIVVRSDADAANPTAGLPAGLYIANGKKIAVR